MPSSYAVMNEEEVTYFEGASLGTITILPIFNKESKLDLMNILREIKKIK